MTARALFRSNISAVHDLDVQTVALVRRDASVALVDRTQLAMLEQCAVPRPLRAHAACLLTIEGGPRTLDDAELRLTRFIDAELLEQVDALPLAAPVTISTLGLTTADRPAMVRRCLTSYVSYLRAQGVTPSLLVADGSRDPANMAATEEAVQAIGREHRWPVSYLGRRHRRRIGMLAAQHGISRRVVEWLIPEPPTEYAAGAVRNLLLLSTAGTPFLTVDDDTLCSTWSPALAGEPSLVFTGHGDPQQWRFFDSRASATARLPSPGADLLAAHTAVLGQRLDGLSAAVGGTVGTTGICRHLVRSIHSPARSRVRVAWSGLAGDAGAYCRYRLLLATGHARETMANSPAVFLTALSSREVQRCAPAHVVSDESSLMTYCSSLDNSALLPPFNPRGFNEDGLFGVLLRMTDPSAFIAHVPVGIVHDSPRPSLYETTSMGSASETRLCDVITFFAARWAAQTRETGLRRLPCLGAFFLDLGRDDIGEFRSALIEAAAAHKSGLTQRCQHLIQSGFPYPAAWRAALDAYRQATLASFADPCWFVPLEYRHAGAGGVRLVQRHLRWLGRALLVWTELWSLFAAGGKRECRAAVGRDALS